VKFYSRDTNAYKNGLTCPPKCTTPYACVNGSCQLPDKGGETVLYKHKDHTKTYWTTEDVCISSGHPYNGSYYDPDGINEEILLENAPALSWYLTSVMKSIWENGAPIDSAGWKNPSTDAGKSAPVPKGWSFSSQPVTLPPAPMSADHKVQ
jgi:hypothetical protein